MARQQIAKKQVKEDLSGVVIQFTDGATVEGNLADFPQEIVTQLALHGLSQKLGDSYAGESDLAVAQTKANGVLERLKSGDWRATREGGGGGGRITDLATAFSNVTGKSVADCAALIDDMDKETKSALRKHPKIAAEVARIAAERAAERAAKAQESGESELDLNSLAS